MLTGRRLLNLIAFLLFAAFCLGLVRLFALRFDTGDIFPPYSTLRADPLGTEIFFESLRALPDYEVTRHERSFDHLPSGRGATLFLLGTSELYLSPKEQSALDRFLRKGGRLVLAFYPRFSNPTPTPSPEVTATPSPSPTPKTIAIKRLVADWQVSLERIPNQDKEQPAKLQSRLPLDRELSWHSGIYFQPQAKDWQTIYAREKRPVIVERAFGAGSIVLAGDSYFLSNEALLVERHAALLAWLAGPNQRLIFDESHLDIHETPGIVSLLRKYRLVGLVLALLTLVSLWLWRNATSSLAPGPSARGAVGMVSGRDSFSGFIALLRRGIAPGQLVELCLAEWRKSQPARTSDPATNAIAMAKNSVAAYNQLSEMIGPKKWKRTTSN